MSFSVELVSNGRLKLDGHFLASEVDTAAAVLDTIDGSCTLDLTDLIYISSAGLRLFLQIQARLNDNGHGLRLINLNEHLRDLFAVTGLEQVFDIDSD